MRYLITLLLILCLNHAFSQNRDYKKFDRAVKLFNNKDYTKSKDLLVKIIEKDNNWPRPHLLLSSIFLEELDFYSAVKSLLNIYDLEDTSDILGIERIANIFYENGFYSEGLYYFNVICKLDSSYCIKKVDRFINNCNYSIDIINNPIDFEPINLGENINSNMSEIGPAITADNQMLIFTRRIESNGNKPQEDFYFSLKKDNIWQQAIAFPHPLNSNLNEGALSFSSDQSLLIYTACNRDDGLGSCDLYYGNSNLKSSSFLNLGKNINSAHWDSQGCFSSDRKFIYFVSNRPGGYGGTDIWISKIDDNSFSKAFNAGPIINTKYDEMSPFIHADNLTLYFSSKGHVGLGDYDIFFSTRDDANSKWIEPKNLGYPINDHLSQNSLVVSSDGKTAFFNSSNEGFGSDDIFCFELPSDIQANEVKGFELDIIVSKKGEEIILNNVHFLNNSFKLEDKSFTELNRLAKYLKNNDINILIEGHTDSNGTLTNNNILSRNRAKSVFDFLLNNGVEKKQITYKGYGSSRPLSNNLDADGRAINRRTSFVIQ